MKLTLQLKLRKMRYMFFRVLSFQTESLHQFFYDTLLCDTFLQIVENQGVNSFLQTGCKTFFSVSLFPFSSAGLSSPPPSLFCSLLLLCDERLPVPLFFCRIFLSIYHVVPLVLKTSSVYSPSRINIPFFSAALFIYIYFHITVLLYYIFLQLSDVYKRQC